MRRPWNANTHYHDLVLSALPAGASRILDVGCGDGLLAAELSDAGVARVVAMDIDAPVLERARARHPYHAIEWLHGDVLDCALEPASFDAVVSVATLHHLDADRALACFASLVRPGGAVVVIGLAANAWYDLPRAAIAELAKGVLGVVRGGWDHTAPMCWPPPKTYQQMRELAERRLPGVRYRYHWLGRYSLIWRRPARAAD